MSFLFFIKLRFPPMPARWWVGHDKFLVMVFAATHRKLVLLPVLSDSNRKMSNFSKYMSNLAKIRMDYSCHA